jgi:LCP family protein required for cell wall assembly
MRARRNFVRSPRSAFPGWVIRVLAGAFILMALLTAFLVYNTVHGVFAAWDGSGLPPLFSSGGAQEGPVAPGATESVPAVEATPPPWNGTDRVTVLVMGLDYRDWETGQGAPRTDTMMLVTLDPVSQTAGILSIPRDLWVEIPGFEHNRINTAYSLGESFHYPADADHPGGGPGLAMRTVENLLGVQIQYYAVIEFSAFERMIDEIGGIDVLVEEPMRMAIIGRPSMDLEAKPYHFDGAEALAYARARTTGSGDFDRSRRQQQVILAIRDSVLDLGNLPTLITRAPAIYQDVASGIHTNMSFDQMISLGAMALQIDPASIRRGVIGPPDMVLLQTLPDGAQVLQPVPDNIRLLRDQIFTLTDAVAPSIALDDPAAASAQEGARVAVRNGAGIEGLATSTADYLRGLGVNVVEVGNADRMDYAKTVIIDYTGNPYTSRYLMTLLNLDPSQVLFQTIPDSPVDVAVICGPDLVLP